MKSEIGSSRGGLRPYPLRFHDEEAGADANLNQHGPLGIKELFCLGHASLDQLGPIYQLITLSAITIGGVY